MAQADQSAKILLAEDDNDMRRFLVKALQNAVDVENTSEAYMLLGRALLLAADDERAEQMLQQATLRLPADPQAFSFLAEASEKRGHFEPARRALLDYIALAGEDLDGRKRAALAMRVGDLSMQLSDYPLALAYYERAAPSMTADTDFTLKLAEAKWRTGDVGTARAMVDKVLEKNRTHAPSLALKRRMR